MGRDKVSSKPPAPPPPPPVIIGMNGKPLIARGHRQKGSGNVITDKGPIVTSDGIVLKSHERLPCQLLQEYCQKEKRPVPKYEHRPPGNRYNVRLEDVKNSKNDLNFCPVQNDFESGKVAKDMSALLALFHLQRSLPLERKLPEPYCTTWLEMLGAEKSASGKPSSSSSSSSSSAPASAAASAAALPSAAASGKAVEKSGKAPAVHMEINLDRATADWLCDQCNSQNFAVFANGDPRLKCFKCRAPKTDTCELVATMASIKASAAAAPADPTDAVKVKKFPPAAVVGLRTAAPVITKAEAERLAAENVALRNKKKGFFDALRRANKPSPVLLSPHMKRLLEAALGLSPVKEVYGHDDPSVSVEAFLAEVESNSGHNGGGEGLGYLSEAESTLSAAVQLDILKRIAAKLSEQGFSQSAVVSALRSISGTPTPDAVLDEFDSASAGTSEAAGPSLATRIESLFLDVCLEFLCLQFDDESLPDQFDARSNESLRHIEVAKKKEVLSIEDQRLVDELLQCGWLAADLVSAIKTATQKPWSGDRALDTLVLLYDATLQTTVDGSHSFFTARRTEGGGDKDFSAAFLTEMETLTSIYADQLAVSESGMCRRLVLALRVQESHPATTLEMIVHPSMQYPQYPPLFLVKNKTSSLADPNFLLSIQCAAWIKAQQCIDEMGVGEAEGIFYQVACFVEEELARGVVSTSSSAPLSLQQALLKVASGDLDSCTTSRRDSTDSSSVSSLPSYTSGGSSSSSSSSYNSSSGSTFSVKRSQHPFWSSSGGSCRQYSAGEIGRLVSNDPIPSTSAGGGSRMDGAKYSSMLRNRKGLPAWESRASFLETILVDGTRGMVVTGETGCGKTTQIPQFLSEANRNAKIVVCQPRRLAAVGVATRVAEEMAVPIGDEVGYMVRGESKATNRTRMVFCTYGVLLRRLQEDPDLLAIDYVILDEVHERGLESDFALALLVSALQRGSSKLKIILMSATISTDKFALYLGAAMPGVSAGNSSPAPVLFIPGYTFPVYEYYKTDFEALLRAVAATPAPSAADDAVTEEAPTPADSGAIGGRKRKGDIDYDLLVRLVMCLAVGVRSDVQPANLDRDGEKGPPILSRAQGSVLLFMPGVPEISRFITLFQQAWPNRDAYIPRTGRSTERPANLKILPLHGNLSPTDQKKVFELADPSELKIVVATNVAEASVTIPDVTVVIDSCRVKEMDYDAEKQMAALVMKMASQDSLRQRRGRAGRVQIGRCFRVITVSEFTALPANSVPEMLRAPLDRLVLQVKSMDLKESCMHLLRRCPDPPARSAVDFAEASLTRMQALDGEGALTPLGRHLAALPCAPKVGRMLVFGSLLNCAYPTSCVAAYLTSRSPFLSAAEPDARQRVDAARAHFARSTGSVQSDHMIIIAAMVQFSQCGGQSEKRRFCRDYSLSYERMQEIGQLQSELLDGIVSLGFISSTRDALRFTHASNANSDKPNVVAAALCAGLYPQLAKILRPPKRFVEVMGSALERDVQGKELKFFIPEHPDDVVASGTTDDICTQGMQRVFIHPSSINFSNASFRASPFVLYGERVMSTNTVNPMAYIRDTTEVTAFPLLFFGGKLEAKYLEGTVTVDSWIKFSAPGRLVALVQALRKALDHLLMRKIADPTFDLSSSGELEAVCRLLDKNGLDK